MFNFITLTITIWNQCKLLYDFTKFRFQKTFR